MLLGREYELARIEELVERAGSGRGGIAVVEGPAGIGKTALLAETAGAVGAEFRVFRATGTMLERGFAFGVVRQLFAPVIAGGGLAEFFKGAAGLARTPLGLSAAEGDRANGWGDSASAAMHGLYWLTVSLAERTPLLLVLDDAQWSDEMSLRFVLYLARRLDDLPVLLLAAERPPVERGDDGLLAVIGALPSVVMLRPSPLSEVDVGRLIGEYGLEGASPQFVEACHRASGGNPFLLGELVGTLREESVRGTAGDAARVTGIAPEGIVRWVVGRTVALGEPAQRLACAFAVLGAEAALSDAEALAELEPGEAVSAAEALIAASILTGARPYAFVHPLVGTAVYDGLLPARRAEMHRRAARLVADRGAPPERVAAHLLASDPGRDGWVVDVLRATARQASTSGAPASAVSYLERALAEAQPATVRAELLLELGEAQLRAGLPGAARSMREGLAISTDPRRRAAIGLSLARALFATGDWPAALETLSRQLTELPEGDDEAFLELRTLYITLGRRGPGERAEAGLGALADDDAPARTRSERLLLVQLAYESAATGARPHVVAATLARRALADGTLLRHSATDVWPYSAACYALLYAGEPDESSAALGRAIDLSQRQGSRIAFGHLSRVRGTAHYLRGDILDALADLESAIETYSEEYEHGLPWTLAFVALCLLERGDLTGAARVLVLRGDEERWRAQPSFRTYLYALGRLRTAQGRLREGLDTLHACGEEALAMNFPNPAACPWRSDAALLAAHLGERDRAAELVDEDVRLARAFGAPHALGAALRTAGLIEGGEDGLEQLAQAVIVLNGSGFKLELARSLTDHGAALRRIGRRREALEPLRGGLDLASRCGALVLAKRAREELIAAGARPRRERIRGVESLTASELRVARMAASGMTNREIAQALFVTRRTVETHLGHAYQKLDVSSREQLANALALDLVNH